MKYINGFNESIDISEFRKREAAWKFKDSRLKAEAEKLANAVCSGHKKLRNGFYSVKCDVQKMKVDAKAAGYNVIETTLVKGFMCEKRGMYFLVDTMIIGLRDFQVISSGKDLKGVTFFDGSNIVKTDFVRGPVLYKSESHKDPSVYSMESTDKKYIGAVSFFGDPSFSMDFDEIVDISKKPGV